jgi:CRISPR-associated protein Cas1
MIIYVTTQGSKVIREGRHLLVTCGESICHTLFPQKLEQLVLCGNVSLTPQALHLLLREGIDTVFLRLDGRYKGRLAQEEPKNVFLRRRQFLLSGDDSFCLAAARNIVSGKLHNAVTVLQRIRRTRQSSGADHAIAAIRNLCDRLDTVSDLAALRGYEGEGAARYFAGLRFGLDDDFGFTRRVRRPPTDPVNAVLSLLYTFLINRMVAAVRVAGLDPYPGVLHALEYGRQALPLDLVEEFRAPLADTVALALFNLRILKKGDFYRQQPVTPALPTPAMTDPLDAIRHDPLGLMSENDDDADLFDLPDQALDSPEKEDDSRQGQAGMRLRPDAFKKVISAFEKKMQTEFVHPVVGERMTYADSMVFQARQFRRLIEGESSTYHPLLLR